MKGNDLQALSQLKNADPMRNSMKPSYTEMKGKNLYALRQIKELKVEVESQQSHLRPSF